MNHAERNSRRILSWTRWTLVALSAGAGGLAMLAASCGGTGPARAPMSGEAKIARGKQIAYSSACVDCHTPGTFYGATDTTRMLSGSELGWEGPWGITFPRNLTPDMETGIGSWTEQDIVNAFRLGHRPDQSLILPPMPWAAYSQMSDEDAFALAAYIKSIPPIRHKAPDRIPPGVKSDVPRLTFPAPPAWDAQNLPQAPDAGGGGH